MRGFIQLVLIVVGVSMGSIAYAEDDKEPATIHVRGSGQTRMKPDKADVNLAIEVRANTAQAAREQAASAMKALLAAIEEEGIEDKDIQTSYMSLQPEYVANNKISGYQLSNQVIVSVHDITKVGAVIDRAVQAGGNATRVQGVSFEVENTTKGLAQARERAYADALSVAEQYAKLAGLKLGKALHINEGGSPANNPIAYKQSRAMLMEASSTPVQAGEETLSVSVEVVFAVE